MSIETYYKKLDPTKTLEMALPKIKEAFIEYYGVDDANRINEKFDNAIIFGYQRPKNVERLLKSMLDEESSLLIREFFEKIGLDNSLENNSWLLDKKTLEYSTYNPLMSFKSFKEDYIKGVEGRNKEQKLALIELVKRYIPDLNEQNFDELKNSPIFKKVLEAFFHSDSPETIIEERAKSRYQKSLQNALPIIQHLYKDASLDDMESLLETHKLDVLESYLQEFEKALSSYGKLKQSLTPYFEYTKKSKENSEAIDQKYLHLLADEFKEYLDDEEYQEFLNGKMYCRKIEAVIGSSLEYSSLIESFNMENEALLQEDNWKSTSVKNDRIKFFRTFGIELGNDYNDYKNSPQCRDLLPPQDVIENISKRRYELLNKSHIEFYESLEEYQENQRKIRSNNLVCNGSFGPKDYEQCATFVAPDVSKTTDGYSMKPVVCISMEGIDEYLDKNIIHEFNHLFETEITEVNSECVRFISGWDKLHQRLGEEEKEEDIITKDDDKREYELFSEIINELIAQDICKILFEKGVYIFGNEFTSKIKGGTSYENTFFIVGSFWENYKSIIIASRRNHNIDIIYDAVGKENFDALNEIFNQFHEHFSEFQFYNALADLQNKQETPDTKFLSELCKKRDEIMNSMQMHYNRQLN